MVRYQLLCLDAGFTLIHPKRPLSEVIAAAAQRHGVQASDGELALALRAASAWLWDIYERGYDWRSDDRIRRVWNQYHEIILRGIGLRPGSGLVNELVATMFTPASWQAYPDVLPALRDLRRIRGLSLAVVSDWNSELIGILRAAGIAKYVGQVLTSGGSGRAKPDPAFYALALDWSRTPPERALMVGDSYRADVLGARSAGMQAVLLQRDGPSLTEPAGGQHRDVPTIRSLSELQRLVLRADTDAADANDG
jgi:HAD superfamily hydrolase (TIGR01509 family)